MSEQLDWLQIRELKISARIGIYAWEQRIEQTILLDIALPIPRITEEVNLAQTIDYGALCNAVTTFVSTQSFELIEAVAQQVAALILAEFKVASVKVSVNKPLAVANASAIIVSVERSRD